MSVFLGILIADHTLHKIVGSPANTSEACETGDLRHCETIPRIIDPVTGEPSPANSNDKAYRDEYRAEKDLRAQRDMALWAMLMFFATLAGVFLLYSTWRETVAVTRETRRIGEAQTRGYVQFIPVSVTLDNGTFYFRYKVRCKGHTPIHKFTVKFGWEYRGTDLWEKSSYEPHFGTTGFAITDLFPGDDFVTQGHGIYNEQFMNRLRSQRTDSRASVMVTAKMAWVDSFGLELHQETVVHALLQSLYDHSSMELERCWTGSVTIQDHKPDPNYRP